MSSTVMLLFEKGEIKKVKEWFAGICPKESYPTLVLPGQGKETIRQVYVEFSRNIMTLDSSIWDDKAQMFSVYIGQELNKYFKLKRAGWDSVGYCKDISEFLNAQGAPLKFYKSRIDELKSKGEDIRVFEEYYENLKIAADFYKKEAKKLMTGIKNGK
jgi:hypothetical protein